LKASAPLCYKDYNISAPFNVLLLRCLSQGGKTRQVADNQNKTKARFYKINPK